MWIDTVWEDHKMAVGRQQFLIDRLKGEIKNPYEKGSKMWEGYEDEHRYFLISQNFKEVMQ